jgi:hypothetical protein
VAAKANDTIVSHVANCHDVASRCVVQDWFPFKQQEGKLPNSNNQNQVTLPQQAYNNMSQHALDNLTAHGNIQPPGQNIIWADPTTTHNSIDTAQILQGHPGQADVFVFDVGAEVANGNGHYVTEITGFEIGLDTIAFVNMPSSLFADPATGVDWGSYVGDPATLDTHTSNTHLMGTGHVITATVINDIYFADTGNTSPTLPHESFAPDYSYNDLNQVHHLLPQDPWLIV